MKKVVLTQVLLLFGILFGYSQFEWQTVTCPVTENLTSVFFIDSNHGFVLSDGGTILETTNAGNLWLPMVPVSNMYAAAIFFSDSLHGCLVGWINEDTQSSLILVTTDGGNYWLFVEHTYVNRFNDVFFIDNNVGWAVGSKGELNTNCIYYTADGGNTWSDQTGILIVNAELFGVGFRNELLGSTCGADGAFFITNNGGMSWAMGISMPILNLNDIYNFGILNGCIVGDEGTALFTVNNWYQYIDQNSNTEENLNAVSGAPETSFLWACGDNGTIIYNSNYLLPWAPQVSNTPENLNDIQMLSPIEGWAVGDNGTILHFNPLSELPQKTENQRPEIYPNPTSGDFFVKLKNVNQFITMKIFQLNGDCIFDGKWKNTDQINVQLPDHSPGVYYVLIKLDVDIITESIIFN
ncbi:MAG: YCF48-related protein [Bacteroidales bacterium]